MASHKAKSSIPPTIIDASLPAQAMGGGIDPMVATAIVEIVDALNTGDMVAVAKLQAGNPEATALLSRAFDNLAKKKLGDKTIKHWRSSY